MALTFDSQRIASDSQLLWTVLIKEKSVLEKKSSLMWRIWEQDTEWTKPKKICSWETFTCVIFSEWNQRKTVFWFCYSKKVTQTKDYL